MPAICFMLLADINIFGPVSGGHMNPAVTLGVLVGYYGQPCFVKKLLFSLVIMLSQVVGAFFGCFMVWLTSVEYRDGYLHPTPALLCPTRDMGTDRKDICDGSGQFGSLFFIEVMMTFIFVGTVLSIIYSPMTNKISGSLIIVCVLYTSGSVAGAISGGAINSAVGIAQQIFQNIMVSSYPGTFGLRES